MLLEGASVFFVKGNSVDDGIVKSRFKENRISVQNLNGTFKTHVKYDAVISCTCPECDGFEHKEGAKVRAHSIRKQSKMLCTVRKQPKFVYYV